MPEQKTVDRYDAIIERFFAIDELLSKMVSIADNPKMDAPVTTIRDILVFLKMRVEHLKRTRGDGDMMIISKRDFDIRVCQEASRIVNEEVAKPS